MATAAGRYRDALAHRDFRRLIGALVVNSAGTWAYNVVLLVYVYERTHSNAWVAASTGARFLPVMLFSVYAGVLAERFERTILLIISTLLSFAVMSGMALDVAAGGPVALLIGLSAVTAVVNTPFNPSVAALTPQIVGERDLAAANALQGTIENVAVIAGPALGAGLLRTGTPTAAFVLNALSFLVAGLGLAGVSARSTPTDVTAGGANLFAQMGVGIRALLESSAAFVLVLFCALDTLVYGTDTVLYVQIARHLGAGSSVYGYLLAGAALGGVLAAGLVNRLASGSRLGPVVVGGMVIFCLPTAFIPLLHSVPIVVALQVIRGGGMLVVDVLAITALQRSMPANLLSRVFGVFETVLLGGATLGAFAMPPLLHFAGLTTALLVMGLAIPALSLLGLPTLLAVDRSTRAATAALEPRIRLLEVLDLFAAAPRPVLETLARAGETVELPAGAVVVREGEPADALYVVVTGEVAVSARGEAQRGRRLRTLGPRSYLGEIGLLRGVPRTATVRTLEPTELFRIAGQDFLDAVSTNQASVSLLSTATSRLASSHPRLATEPVAPQPAATGAAGT